MKPCDAPPILARRSADVPGAAATVRFHDDEDDDVRLLAEVTVPELVAAQLWRASSSA